MNRSTLLIVLTACALAGPGALLARQAPPLDAACLTGADISLLAKMEEEGAVYREGETARDLLDLLKARGCRLLRLRLWVQPSGRRDQVCDLPYTLALAQRIKRAGFQLLLDLHYSDTWADPAHQEKPAAWRDLPFDALQARVRDYSCEVVRTFHEGGAMPDLVQVGNEVSCGLLWPDGRLWTPDASFPRFAALLRAGIEGVRAGADGAPVQVMIHTERSGDPGVTLWFFEQLEKESVPFDLIGLSCYPYWHGPLARLQENLHGLAARFRKPILVVEAGYPWRGSALDAKGQPMAYPATPQGQRRYLEELLDVVRGTPDGLGRGVLWWAPEWIPTQALGAGWSPRTLFDDEGRALPALDAFCSGGSGPPALPVK